MCKLYAFNIHIDLLSTFGWKFNLLLQIRDLVIFVCVHLVIFVCVHLVFNCLVYTSLNVYTYSLSLSLSLCSINPLAPSDPYMGRTAQLTSRHCILNTYSTNIRAEYFKCAK
jgi:hypothetical protein